MTKPNATKEHPAGTPEWRRTHSCKDCVEWFKCRPVGDPVEGYGTEADIRCWVPQPGQDEMSRLRRKVNALRRLLRWVLRQGQQPWVADRIKAELDGKKAKVKR